MFFECACSVFRTHAKIRKECQKGEGQKQVRVPGDIHTFRVHERPGDILSLETGRAVTYAVVRR